jgi:hypothetical protein
MYFEAGGVIEDDVDDVVAVEVAGLAEELLDAVVVVVLAKMNSSPSCAQAGEGAGALADVVLGVVADAEGEQLHQLAGVVSRWDGLFGSAGC